ncbi:MAG: 1-deoxy-D-xylulose-5-phosphate synthase [Candidatus Aureabacteria bacterium]|nr:1-deoxy-D-xylulose-5-phosphate synthase [Candidatus Auribacterota bacterium]
MSKYLEKIESPEDLKKLKLPDLELLAREIRERLVQVVSVTGGHLASSLGAVEITIALHYVFDCPRDKIVWDVGHQAYAHKVLTGRNSEFSTLRKMGGLCGFPKRSESEYDIFGAGHASTAVSAAMGLCAARDLHGGGEKVIAVIGDGSLTGGLCYEAFNNAGNRARNLLVILNDNEMSISRNVGAISAYLTKILTSQVYNRVRTDMQVIVKSIPAIGDRLFNTARRLEESLKNMIVPGILFEELGFRYFGPVDGHDIGKLIEMFDRLKKIEQPVILHVVTRKGKGYVHAEQHAEYFHGTSPFDIGTGKPKKESTGLTYSEIFGSALTELARGDPAIISISAAMSHGTGLGVFADEFPTRFFDVGIAEGHAVLFAAGLAAGGYKPVVAIYATFLQRAYDQIVHDVCLQKLAVVFAVDRGGIVGADGSTHSGQFALSYLRHIPNLILMEPADARELVGMLRFALSSGKPSAIVYPKGDMGKAVKLDDAELIMSGKARLLREGRDVSLVAIGQMVRTAEEVAQNLAREHRDAAVINARFVKPLDVDTICEAAKATRRLVILEENAIQGGFGSAVLEMLAERGISDVETLCIGIGDQYVEHGGRQELLAALGLDSGSVTRRIKERFWPSSQRK